MPGLREHLLGSPERCAPRALRRILVLGSATLKARAALALAQRAPQELPEALSPLLQDPVPGVRRAAARAMARAPQAALLPALRRAAATERCATPLLAMATAMVRCGAPLGEASPLLRAQASLELNSARGPRSPEQAMGLGPELAQQALERALGLDAQGRPAPLEQLAQGLRAALQSDDDRQALEDLAALGLPEDAELLERATQELGRRGLNSAFTAMGLHGDPRWLSPLRAQLGRMDLDPGRGFAWRRLCAFSLGRLGFREPIQDLLRAIEVEATEHEGRPGAGLGIQFPVRAAFLWALGELQAVEAVPTLVAHLNNLHGSAMGGFHLPAMGALLKIGAPARAALRRVQAQGPEEARLNAAGVLAALGG